MPDTTTTTEAASETLSNEIRENLGSRRVPPVRASNFPDASAQVQSLTSSNGIKGTVEVLLVLSLIHI